MTQKLINKKILKFKAEAIRKNVRNKTTHAIYHGGCESGNVEYKYIYTVHG